MADNKKIYQIQINGIDQSIKQVDALSNTLDALDKKIKAMENSNVKINAGGGSKTSSSSLSEEEKLAKQIEQTDAKRVAYSQQTYQNYLAAKDVLKETINDQKALAAQERLTADNYSNTMAGMKQQLADIKSVLDTTDISDDSFGKLTAKAGELNEKLKEIEKSYGSFGRNVGNYASAAEGFQTVKIAVGDTVREFSNAREASRTLNNELKAMAINGQANTEEYKKLRQVVMELESTMNDAKKPMDKMMDTMQSFTAIASVGKGFSAFFGFDDNEIQQSIQKLLALQNALKGLETINKQIQTREGIGAWIAPFNTGIDASTKKILVFNRALLGTGKVAKTAAVGVKFFSKAIKIAFSSGILIAVDLLVEAITSLIEKFKEANKTAEYVKAVEEEAAKAYAEGTAQIIKYKAAIQNFNGTKEQEKKLVNELNAELGNSLGVYHSLADWMDTLTTKGADYIDMLELQAKAQASFNNLVKAFEEVQNAKNMSTEDFRNLGDDLKDFLWSGSGTRSANERRVKNQQEKEANAETVLEDYIKIQKEADAKRQKMYGNTSGSTTSAKKYGNAVSKSELDIANMRIKAMKEGFAKTLLELEYEKKRRIAEAVKSGKLVSEQIELIEKEYNDKLLKVTQEHHQAIVDEERQFNEDLANVRKQTEARSLDNQSTRNALKKDEYISNYIQNKYEGNPVEFFAENDSYEVRFKARKDYYGHVLEATKEYNRKELALEQQRISAETKNEIDAENKRFSGQVQTLEERYEKAKTEYDEFLAVFNKMSAEDQAANLSKLTEFKAKSADAYNAYVMGAEQALIAHKAAENSIIESGNLKIQESEKKFREEDEKENEAFLNNIQSELEIAIQRISKRLDSAPKTNSWGFVNLSATSQEIDEIDKQIDTLYKDIASHQATINVLLKNGLSTEGYDKLNEALQELIERLNLLKEKAANTLIEAIEKFIETFNNYFQTALQGVQTIMDAFAGYEDYQFDKEQKALDDLNDMLSKKLQEQEEIISEHSNNINSIENDLANARGDRRDHLIDQLNAEIEAQRNAERERRNIEKQQEQAEKEQEKLDKKRQEAEYKRNLSSILVSTAMATANGLATKPFVPVGIAMGALATALGMVQYALAKKQKPYGEGGQLDGGVAQGASHRDGGIPVLGGKASIEGGEFITNRTTTSRNVELLEYINSKKKRINIDDMLEFYSNGQGAKRAITTVRTKFADGGVIPTLRTDVDINDRLIQSFEDYSNRPVQVAVVDIIDKTQQVREVQTMAGLKV